MTRAEWKDSKKRDRDFKEMVLPCDKCEHFKYTASSHLFPGEGAECTNEKADTWLHGMFASEIKSQILNGKKFTFDCLKRKT